MTKGAKAAADSQVRPALDFNFNKLQAVLCIAASAAVSISLILWAVNALF